MNPNKIRVLNLQWFGNAPSLLFSDGGQHRVDGRADGVALLGRKKELSHTGKKQKRWTRP